MLTGSNYPTPISKRSFKAQHDEMVQKVTPSCMASARASGTAGGETECRVPARGKAAPTSR